jgi:protein tyrosine/serine phosphatase
VPRRFLTAAVGLILSLGFALAAEEVWQAFSFTGEKLSIEGVDNFGRIDRRLYRGAQPTPAGFAALKAMGIETVVRLSLGEEGSAAERTQVESLGMTFVNLPWSTARIPGTDVVVPFLKLMRDNPDRRIFVHCKAGADRTGVMVAVYRITFNRWTPSQAIEEMKAFHYRYLFLPHLQGYVERFPERLSTEPAFSTLETASAY